MKLSEEEFDRIVKRALRRMPAEIGRHLDNIIISVRKRPSKKMLREMGLAEDEDIFGIFEGSPADRAVSDVTSLVP